MVLSGCCEVQSGIQRLVFVTRNIYRIVQEELAKEENKF